MKESSCSIHLTSASPSWVLWFFACLTPFYLSGLSVNYLFIFTLLTVLFGVRLTKPNSFPALPTLLLAYSCISVLSTLLFQPELLGYAPRRITSFFLFVSMFTFFFIRITNRMLVSFLAALILIGVTLSTSTLVSLFQAINISGMSNVFALKGEVGTQRTGFMLLFGFWTSVYFASSRTSSLPFKAVLISASTLILLGLIFTFSRSSYLALGASIVLALLYLAYMAVGRVVSSRKAKPLTQSPHQYAVLALIIIVASLSLGVLTVPSLMEFAQNQIVNFFLDRNYAHETLSNEQSSEGARLKFWGTILSFIGSHPFTGSGFLGVWVIDPLAGSSHSEFFDRLFRLGILGFVLYLAVLGQLQVSTLRHAPFLAFALFGTMVFGLFHETFSLSHGAALFAFLLASSFQRKFNVL